jgi:hypothetical protein
VHVPTHKSARYGHEPLLEVGRCTASCDGGDHRHRHRHRHRQRQRVWLVMGFWVCQLIVHSACVQLHAPTSGAMTQNHWPRNHLMSSTFVHWYLPRLAPSGVLASSGAVAVAFSCSVDSNHSIAPYPSLCRRPRCARYCTQAAMAQASLARVAARSDYTGAVAATTTLVARAARNHNNATHARARSLALYSRHAQ